MKVKELLERRKELRSQKKDLLSQIDQETAKMNKVDLQEFLRSGDAGQVNGFELEKLAKKRNHLKLLGESLDEAIVQAQKIEKERKRAKLLRQAEAMAYKRAKLTDKIRHFLYKVQALQKEAREAHTEERALTAKARQDNSKTVEVSLRLGKVEEFLEDHILKTNDIEEKVEKAKLHNRKILEKENIGINDFLYQNFKVKWNRKSLEVLEFDLIGNKAEMLLRAEHVTRDSLLEEIC